MLSILALGMLVTLGCAFDDYGSAPHGGDHFGAHDGHSDFGGHGHYDWLNPGGYYSYSYWYPTYTYTWYPTYTYTYPTYYTTPVVYPTYTYYDPVVYDPWYAANVYGWAGTNYYYSSGWSWSRYGGYYFV
jgi:hypothetical protein